MPWITPNRLTEMTQAKSSSGSSAIVSPRLPTPALLHTRWTSPKRSRVAAASAVTSASTLTSVGTVTTSAPAAASSSPACSRTGRSMSATTSVIPSAANRLANARPMPDAPPVTTATFPASSPSDPQQVGGVQQVGIVLQLAGCPGVADATALEHERPVGEPEATWANCSMSNTPTPDSAIDARIGTSRLTTSGARPSDSSSTSTTDGRDTSAWASTTICCSPPDNDRAIASQRCFSSGNSSRA